MSGLLTAEAVAAVLAVRPALVRALAHRGELPFVRVGPKLLWFRPEDVERYVAARLLPGRQKGRGVA